MTATFVSLPVGIHAQSDCAKQLAERFLDDALKIVESRFKNDLERLHLMPCHYAARYPELIASLMQAQAVAFQTLEIAEQLRDIREKINEHSTELLGVAESAGIYLDGIERNLDRIVDAVRTLDRA